MNLLSRAQCAERLRAIFPSGVVEDQIVTSPLADAAAYVCTYVGAFEGHNPIRPTMVLWMCDQVEARARTAPPDEFHDDRAAWYAAALSSHRALVELLSAWGITHAPWYADNSRETLRDEVFRQWRRLGAMLRDDSIPTTSSRPAWSLRGEFAALLSPSLAGDDLTDAIEQWQTANLGAVGRTRLRLERQRTAAAHGVSVQLPTGGTRVLHPGDSSLLLQGVIEQLAPRFLRSPAVLAISESARKVDVLDSEVLADLGLEIEADRLLPDALLFDADDGTFWFVEAVVTGGEITAERREELLGWAAAHDVPTAACGFISAFLSRTHDVFRRRVASLAWGTRAWFLDEPARIVRLDELAERAALADPGQ